MDANTKLHMWQHCHHCNSGPILGLRYECQSCPAGPDIDLCSSCFILYQNGEIEHPTKEIHLDLEGPHRFVSHEGVPAASFRTWLNVPILETKAPRYQKGFLVRPEFCFGTDSAFGGYAFVVNTAKGRMLLTALHVLDEVIKKNDIDATVNSKSYTGLELPNVIDAINLYDVLEEKWMFYELGSCTKMLVLFNARTGEVEPKSNRDISAFWIEENAQVQAGNLADKSSEIGQTVWLAAKSTSGSLLRKAVVVYKNQSNFIFRYASNEALPKYCSGAPILDCRGDVVAINVGSGKLDNQRFGHANHVENIHRHLECLN